MNHREELIKIITSDSNFKKICSVLNSDFPDDIFQEVCLKILEMPENRLPRKDGLNFWFYCMVRNLSSRTGTFGKMVLKDETPLETKGKTKELPTESKFSEKDIRAVELFMLELTEFESRVILLYNQLGDMKKVERETGISYSALRAVKEKIKQKAKEL
jgi:hypothetical protein